MNPQLAELATALSESGVRFWLESGTLLGVCRNGDIIPWDKDLDFGCWVEESPQLLQAATELKRQGYAIRVERLAPGDPQPTTVVIRPRLWQKYRHGQRTATVAVYRRYGGRALRPGAHFTRSTRTRWSLMWLFDEAARFGLRWIWLRCAYPRMIRLPWPRIRFTPCTWSIPAHFFDDLSSLSLPPASLPVPMRWAAYLAFRYGNWSDPDPDWDYFTDDGGLIPKRFDVVVNEGSHV